MGFPLKHLSSHLLQKNDDIFKPLESRSIPNAHITNTAEYLGAPIITPVTTTDEVLGPDKGRITQPVNTKNTSEACRKSEKILCKFWADGLKTQ